MPRLPKCPLPTSKTFHISQNQDDLVVHPPRNITNFHHLYNCITLPPPFIESSRSAPCWGLPPRSCPKRFSTFWTAWLYHKLCACVQLWEIIRIPRTKSTISNITMLKYLLSHNITTYTYSPSSCIHVSTTKFRNISCPSVATGVILWSS